MSTVTDLHDHTRRRVPGIGIVKRIGARPAGAVSLAIVALVILGAAFAPLIATHSPNETDVLHTFSGPSGDHLLGTDYLGRDLFSRIIYGARTALEIALPAIAIGFALGYSLGLAAGYVGGLADRSAVVVIDTLLAFPGLILALAVLTLIGNSKLVITGLIAISFVPSYARLARAQTLALKEQQFIRAERALGVSRSRLILRHIAPNVLPPLLVLIALDVPAAIGLEAGLSFLGIGVQKPTPDWGVMLNDGFLYVQTSAWGLIGPLAVLGVVTAAFTMIGESVRDFTDQRNTLGRGVFDRGGASTES